MRRALALLLALFLCSPTVLAQETLPTFLAPQPLPVAEPDTRQVIVSAAIEAGIDPEQFLKVSECEDPGLIADQQSNYVYKGVREESYGIFQINIKAHPEISVASATDPVWASRWSATAWKEGYEYQWSCARVLGYIK